MKTKDEFKQWLKALPAQTEFCDGLRIHSCPIAKFTGEMAEKGAPRNPDWANQFMSRYDAIFGHSLAEAIRIAETL